MSDDPSARFGAALVEVEEALDWTLLGRAYCTDGGDDFFSAEQREAQRDASLRFAADVAEQLGESADGSSLYVGAGVAEVPPVLCEALLLGREVHACSLPGPEADELNRALAVAQERVGFELPRWSTTPLAQYVGRDVNHLWFVSVLTDPDAFPALHDDLYERGQPRQRSLIRERERALGLLSDALRCVSAPTAVHVSEEEVAPLVEACAARNLRVELEREGRLSPIVGDVVRRGRLLFGSDRADEGPRSRR